MIIEREKSIMPACDVDTLNQLHRVVKITKNYEGIIGYKTGFNLGYGYGLSAVVDTIKEEYPDAVVIHDHQKAGTDIPAMGKKFAKRMKEAGVDAAILFPQAGPVTEEAWIKALQDKEVGVIVGGRMTHKAYTVSEGGYISDESAIKMYLIAAKLGVTDFVVPGNKPEIITQIKEGLNAYYPDLSPVFYAPGFVAQGGEITDAANAAGDRWHAICGRAVYNPKKRESLDDVTNSEMEESIAKLVEAIA